MSTRTSSSNIAARNQALFSRVVTEGFSQGDLTVIDEVISAHHVEHQAGMGAGPEGVKGAIAYLPRCFRTLP